MNGRRRQSRRLPAAAGAALIAALAPAALAACSSSPTAAATTTTTRPAPASTSSTAATTTTALPPPTTVALTTPPPATSTSTTTPGAACTASDLEVSKGGGSGAAGTIGLGFVITNTSSTACTLDGYPVIALVAKTPGTLHPQYSTGAAPSPVRIASGEEAGFVIFYTDIPTGSQTSCPGVTHVVVTLPSVSGAPSEVPVDFDPCGPPDIRLTPVLSAADYQGLIRTPA